MKKITTVNLFKHVILSLIFITGRRSTKTIACAFMDAIIQTLQEKYSYLTHITIKDLTYFEGVPQKAIQVKTNLEKIPKNQIGESIESIIRILLMDLEEESGLFFLKELKERIGDTYLVELKNVGVDIELLKIEQRHLHEQLERRKSLVNHDEDDYREDLEDHILEYSWDAVASFKYRNNICFLYDKNGRLLDKLRLNKIIEYYVRTLTDFGKDVQDKDEINLTEKQYEFLKMLYARDLDVESAIFLLRMTEAEFNHMVQRLLRYEILRHVSMDEIKITDKGIKLLEERQMQLESMPVKTG